MEGRFSTNPVTFFRHSTKHLFSEELISYFCLSEVLPFGNTVQEGQQRFVNHSTAVGHLNAATPTLDHVPSPLGVYETGTVTVNIEGVVPIPRYLLISITLLGNHEAATGLCTRWHSLLHQ